MKNGHDIGFTKSAGYEFGIRRTFNLSAEDAWNFLFSPEGLSIWLGNLGTGLLEVHNGYKTKQGTEGQVTVLKPMSHIRLTWKESGGTNLSTLQVRVIKAKEKATISIHHEKLRDGIQREEMKVHWQTVMDALSEKISTMQTSL